MPLNSEGRFLGGAEVARQNARRKAKATRILRPGEANLPPRDYLSTKMPPMERFFASLFKSPASDFVNVSQDGRNRLMGDVCRRLGLPPPTKLRPLYESPSAHFEYRAALVMEETRHAVSEALVSLWRGHDSGTRVTLNSMETRKDQGHVVFCFEKKNPFTPRELYDIRPGCCFEILPPGTSSVTGSLLASVVSNRRDFDEDRANQKRMLLMVFAPFGEFPSNAQWRVRPLAGLISNLRQFEACTSNAHRVPFLHALLGHKGATHTRFEDDDEGKLVAIEDEKREEPETRTHDNDEAVSTHAVFSLPVLNETQEFASRSFLTSPPSSVSVVQGPPGTGKSTLLVSIICRYLLESASRGVKRRLMVCAPTNKAVTVLVTRYIESISSINRDPFNVILIGEQDKLLNEEQSMLASHETTCPAFRVRNIFAYTWIHGVVEDCRYLQHKLKSEHVEFGELINRLLVLCSRVLNSLATSILDVTLAALIYEIQESAREASRDDDASPSTYSRRWDSLLTDLVSNISLLDPNVVVRELMESADVIFCTLASAGSSAVKYSSSIDDLIVDEAAAATEPELYIPFHLSPSRLLVVGDPLQLPATVLSRPAEQMGLCKSLHERLMYDLGCDHIMLNVQYRMRPEISQFPSLQFYKGEIMNGDNVASPSYRNTVSLLNDNAYVFLQVEGRERQVFNGSFNNTAEAEAVAELVKRLRRDEREWYAPEKIRIITFYQAQVSLLKRVLSERNVGQVVVATVDSSQGCEADIVIVSFVRSIDNRNERRKSGNPTAGFLSDNRRLNVALTRAKYQLICVGNAHSYKSLPETLTLNALSHDASRRDCICPGTFLGASFSKKIVGMNNTCKPGGGKRSKQQRPGNNKRTKKRQKSRQTASRNGIKNPGKGKPLEES